MKDFFEFIKGESKFIALYSITLLFVLYSFGWIHELGHYVSAKYIFGLDPYFVYRNILFLKTPIGVTHSILPNVLNLKIIKAFGPLFSLVFFGGLWFLLIKSMFWHFQINQTKQRELRGFYFLFLILVAVGSWKDIWYIIN